VVYQIYPRSFQDSNGDGIGDLKGIAARLPYIADLGVDAIWLSPIYPSPMADFGYDVSNYVDIDPLFGSLKDFDVLVTAAHGVGLKVIMDLVPNHTSSQHPWFVESRSSRDNPKRDWFIWRDGRGGGPPTNWMSEFGGSAWTYDEATGQYYYHAYLAEQPDLNWRNPEVVAAIHDVIRFWLSRGVDGFRLDTIHHLVEDPRLLDNPPNPAWRDGMPPTESLLRSYTVDQPETQDVLAGFRHVADEYPERVLIGEAYLPLAQLVAYYGRNGKGLQLPFNFHLLTTPWRAQQLAALILEYESLLPQNAWPNWVLGNHDRQRLASRIGVAQARVAAMLLLTLRGTPTLYYGDELGMTDVTIAPEQVQDPWEKNVPGFGLGRDPVRTPMAWDGGNQAGFTQGSPWLPLHGDAAVRNVAVESDDPHSLLNLYRALLALRRREPALSIGAYGRVGAVGDEVLAYERVADGRRLAIYLNLTDRVAQPIALAAPSTVLLSTHELRAPVGTSLILAANEGIVLAL
jgi:alpha-glucosidase